MEIIPDNPEPQSQASRANKTALDTLLQAAVLAPSGDNTQPWRFLVDRTSGSIGLDVDPARDPSPMNAGQRMARISLGAALENMVQTAERNHWPYEIDETPPGALTRLSVPADATMGTIDPVLALRATNRRRYDGQPLPRETIKQLSDAAGSFASTDTVLISDPDQMVRLVRLIGRADALMLGTKAIRNAFLAKVRFDAAPTAEVTEGLSLGSLEVSLSDRLSLRLMRYLPPPDGLMRLMGARRIFTRVATKLASSAAGICLITTSRDDAQGDIDVGRAWQRIWLRMTQEQLACQPMMSLLVLRNIIQMGDVSLFGARDFDAAKTLLQEFDAQTSKLAGGRPAVLMRFGTAAPPTARVRRLPPADSTQYV